jgi:hypothetical protein
MLIAIVPVLAMVVGLLLWAAASNAMAKAIGEKLFTCGLLVTLFVFARVVVKMGPS